VVHVVLAGLPTGLQQFPADTQTKLHELLGKLKAEMMPPYGTPPPYAAMYAQGTPYQQAPMPLGSHPYSPYPMQSPNGTVQTPTSGAGGTETDKSSKNKRKDPLKRSREV